MIDENYQGPRFDHIYAQAPGPARRFFFSPLSQNPVVRGISGLGGSIFSGSNFVYWLLFAIFITLGVIYRDNLFLRNLFFLISFGSLVFRPQLLDYINRQIFGGHGRKSALGYIIQFIFLAVFLWANNFIVQIIMIIFLFLVLFIFPSIYQIYLKLEHNRELRERSLGASGRTFPFFKLLFTLILDGISVGLFLFLPGSAYSWAFAGFAILVSGFMWGAMGIFLGGIVEIALIGMGFGWFPTFFVVGIISTLKGIMTRNMTAQEIASVRHVTASIRKIILVLFLAMIVFLAPLSALAYYTTGDFYNVPGAVGYQIGQAERYKEYAQTSFADWINQTKQRIDKWWDRNLMIASGDYYTGQVDKYSKGKFGVFIKKVTPYEKNFFLDDEETNFIVGIDLEGGALEVEDCDTYKKKKSDAEGIINYIRTQDAVILGELGFTRNEEQIIRGLFNIIEGRPARIEIDLTDDSVPANLALYENYEECIAAQTVNLSCDIQNKRFKKTGNVNPASINMFDLISAGEGFECSLPKAILDRQKLTESVNVRANFPFTTKAYIKTYFMHEDKKRDLKRSGQDILNFYGIVDKKPRAIYTGGPIMIGMEPQQDLPLSVRSEGEPRSTRLGITLDNKWGGVIKNISMIYIAVPLGVDLTCTPEIKKSKPMDNVVVHKITADSLKRYFDIKNLKTFYCMLKPRKGVLDPSPITTKYVKVIVKYNYEISKKAIVNYKRGDGMKGTLLDCDNVCKDADGCYCEGPVACDFIEADFEQTCNGLTKAQSDQAKINEIIRQKDSICPQVESCRGYEFFERKHPSAGKSVAATACKDNSCKLPKPCFPKYKNDYLDPNFNIGGDDITEGIIAELGEDISNYFSGDFDMGFEDVYDYCANCEGARCEDFSEGICSKNPCNLGCAWSGSFLEEYPFGKCISVGKGKLYREYCDTNDIDTCNDYFNVGIVGCSNDFCDLKCYPAVAGKEMTECIRCRSYPPEDCKGYQDKTSCEVDSCDVGPCGWYQSATKDYCDGVRSTGTITGEIGIGDGIPDVGDIISDVLGSDSSTNQGLIIKKAKDMGIPESIALAVAYVESKFTQFNSDGSVLVHGNDYGIMQVNYKWTNGEYGYHDFERLKSDTDYNIYVGLSILKHYYDIRPSNGAIYDVKGIRYCDWGYALRKYNGWGRGGNNNYVEDVAVAASRYSGHNTIPYGSFTC